MADTLRLVAIDLAKATPALREAIISNADGILELCRRASVGCERFELVVISEGERLELYSTEAFHVTAFGRVLGELAAHAGERLDPSAFVTTEARGVVVAERLLSLAAGLAGPSGLDILGKLNLAVARARTLGTLGPELSALFTSAVHAGWRAYCETAVGDSTKSPSERDLGELAAARIVQEELVLWKTKRQSAERSPRPLDTSYYRRYSSIPVLPGRRRFPPPAA